jgi:flagellar hook-associated protein 2
MSSSSAVTTSSTTGTSINVASIVSQLMTVEQRPLTALATKQAGIQAKISAYGSVQGALSGFQSAMSGLINVNSLQGLTATASDTTVLGASASNIATPGNYSISVTSLAQSQQLVAAGQSSQTTAIGSGATTTLTFDFGSIAGGTLASGKYTGASFTSNGNGTKTVTIGAANNSLQGIRDAINAANVGVTASIVNDGSANPYRLALSSSAEGASNSVKISVAGDTTLNTLLAQDPANSTGQNLSETTTAQNANFTVNGVPISKSSNTVGDVVHGVTLNLLKVSSTPINLSIAQNSTAISTAVNSFVTAYNTLHTAITSVTSYDAAAKKGSVLQGDFAVNTVARQVRQILNTSVIGGGALTSLADIGVTFQKDGTIALDSTKLNSAVTNHYSDIAALFGTVGSASDSLISYVSAPSTVKAGKYAVEISQLATQGSITGLGAVGTTTITAGSNDALTVAINGVGVNITLTPGSYTAASLAAEVQTKINGSSAIAAAGASVAVSQNAGLFTIMSNKYGSSSTVDISGNGTNNLLGGAPTPISGLDVAGTIDGGNATGSGQFLTSGGGNSLGIKIQVSGGLLGARSTVNYSQGYAYSLYQYATSQATSSGLLENATAGLNKSITVIGKQTDALNVRLASIQAAYTKQFTSLDGLLSSMNTTSTYLTQQLTSLQNLQKSA